MGCRGFVLGKALISKLFSDPCSAPPFSLRVCGFRAVAAAREAGATAETAAAAAVSEEGRRIRKVGVFWDLDNKPPKQVPPFVAALHLRNVAGKFGEVVDVVAYANRHAFSFLPQWVKEQRKDRKLLDKLETAGVVKVSPCSIFSFAIIFFSLSLSLSLSLKRRSSQLLRSKFFQCSQRGSLEF